MSIEYLIVGGTGSIGSVVVDTLAARKATVHVFSRGERKTFTSGRNRTGFGQASVYDYLCDVTIATQVEKCFLQYFNQQDPTLDGIVYCVGHCPPGGFDKAIEVPLSNMSLSYFMEEHNRQVVGLFNTLRQFQSQIKPLGNVVVVGSAITRLTPDDCPPFLHAWQYSAAKAAQLKVTHGFRCDPAFKGKDIRFTHISPIAVDTPFHEGCQHNPPAKVSIERVIKEIVSGLSRTISADVTINPSDS